MSGKILSNILKNKKKFLISIDQGTTSSRAILFDQFGKLIFKSQKDIHQYFPKNGWVEQKPEEIWNVTKKVLIKTINVGRKINGKICAIGIANQRETTILWNKITGKPIYNAIVWQDRRTANFCKRYASSKNERLIRKKTGLVIDPYFSATKIKWIIDNVKIAKKLLKKKTTSFWHNRHFSLMEINKRISSCN